jgi:DNA repair photolyase
MWLHRAAGVRLLFLPGLRVGKMRLNGRSASQPIRGSRVPAAPTVSEPTLFPSAGPPIRPSALPVLDQRLRDATYYEQDVRGIINGPETTGMGFWSLNPYVGCEFGCTYCYARYTHRYAVERAENTGRLSHAAFEKFDGEEWRAFEHRIFVKRRESVLAALERDLAGYRRKASGASLVIGTATDPYQPAERRFEITRAVLERLSRERGYSFGIISKSTLITRDIQLLKAIQEHNALTINVSLIGTDVRLVKLFEARSPMPHARLRALKRMTDAGLNAGLIAAPILPGISDTEPRLDALLAAAKRAGARFAVYSPLRLYAGVRQVFLPVIDRHYPKLAEKYRSAFRGAGFVHKEYRKALSERFHRLLQKHGLRRDESMRDGEPPDSLRQSAPEQLRFI